MLFRSDGEPNMPFYLVWANEAFVWKWTTWKTGKVSNLAKGEVQVPQTYPEEGWRPHFEYLLKFFKHKNYYKIDGKPVLAVFFNNAPEKASQQVPPELFEQYRKWAIEEGFPSPGLHILQWFHGKSLHKGGTTLDTSTATRGNGCV